MKQTLAQRAMEFPLLVSIYESRLWRRSPVLTALLGISFEAEQRLVVEAAGLVGDETVLDLACGTGIYARPVARRLPRGRVVGVDLSPPMLRHAAQRARTAQLRNVWFTRASALTLPFADARFDVVLCTAALHLMPDPMRVLAEIHRVLAPGGSLVVAVFRIQSGWLARTTARARGGIGTHAFSAEGLERDLARAGFRTMRPLHARAGWLIMHASKER